VKRKWSFRILVGCTALKADTWRLASSQDTRASQLQGGGFAAGGIASSTKSYWVWLPTSRTQ